MVGKTKTASSKELGAVSKLYLLCYNFGQFFGWSYLLIQTIAHFLNGGSLSTLWDTVKWTLIIFQNGASLEIVHVALGLVKSNLAITTVQVFSRLMVVNGLLVATPTAPLSYGLLTVIVAWGITETVRYLFYALNSLNSVPYLLIWFRYTFFFFLYPMGVTGELLCFYSAQKYIADTKQWSMELPNALNFTFSYLYFLWILMISYIPGFPPMYLHMIAQRKKIIGQGSQKKKS